MGEFRTDHGDPKEKEMEKELREKLREEVAEIFDSLKYTLRLEYNICDEDEDEDGDQEEITTEEAIKELAVIINQSSVGDPEERGFIFEETERLIRLLEGKLSREADSDAYRDDDEPSYFRNYFEREWEAVEENLDDLILLTPDEYDKKQEAESKKEEACRACDSIREFIGEECRAIDREFFVGHRAKLDRESWENGSEVRRRYIDAVENFRRFLRERVLVMTRNRELASEIEALFGTLAEKFHITNFKWEADPEKHGTFNRIAGPQLFQFTSKLKSFLKSVDGAKIATPNRENQRGKKWFINWDGDYYRMSPAAWNEISALDNSPETATEVILHKSGEAFIWTKNREGKDEKIVLHQGEDTHDNERPKDSNSEAAVLWRQAERMADAEQERQE